MNKLIPQQLVSIIMPMYNASPYIADCISSIISQTYQHWELLIVDDFSSDNSKEIVGAFAQKDTRIKLYNNLEKGITPALQLAYKKSSGQYITRMDADDLMSSYKLQSLISASETNPKACITAKVKYFSDQKLGDGYIKYANWLNSMIDRQNHYQEIYKECIIPSPCWLIKRKVFDLIGAFDSFIYPEDYELCFRIYKFQIPILGIDKVLHHWRDHGARASRNDPHYADQQFLQLKIHYFLELDHNKNNQLVIWGAGKSGKDLAKRLISSKINFSWLTDNPNKIGHNIYDIILEDSENLHLYSNKQIIICIKQADFYQINSSLIQQLKLKNQVFSFF